MNIIGAPDAWDEGSSTGHGVTVAVIDSGLDLTHPDFACPDKVAQDLAAAVIDGQVLRGAKAGDIDGHGTHVAGIVGACTNNGTGVVGVAPDSTIVPYRVFTTEAEGAGQLNDIAVAVETATDDGAHVINMSLGIGIGALPFVGGVSGYRPNQFPRIDAAIEYAQSQGVVVVIAAGNSGVLPLCEYPAIAEDAICVGATDENDLKSWYGTFPNKPDAEDGIGPTISAPGGVGTRAVSSDVPGACEGAVFSTFWRKAGSACSDPGYDAIDGTSMASPHVAGAAALVYDRLGGDRSAANRELITQTLLETSEDLGTPGYDPIYGHGRLDALAAVQAIATSESTTVAFTEDSTDAAQYSDDATIGAKLTDESGDPIEGAELTFEMVGAHGSRSWTLLTGADGVATETKAVSDAAGQYQLRVHYAGKTDVYQPSSDDGGVLVVSHEDSSTALEAGPPTGKGKKASRTLTATVSDPDGSSFVAGRIVSFYSDGELMGTAVTNDQGIAVFNTPHNYAYGHRVYEARFAGDDFYIASSGSATG